METPPDTDGMVHTFCIGQHESKRLTPVTPEVVQKAHESNYDMLTTPITSSHFHSRVLTLLSNHLSSQEPPTRDAVGTLATSHNTRTVTVPPLSPVDTPLTPHEAISQVVGITSSWIDLCSPDPLIADISRQVLMLEVAYAAFCGIGYLVIPGPRLHHGRLHSAGVTYYARAIQEALNLAPYVQIHIWMRMVDSPDQETNEMGDLAPFAREEYLAGGDDRPTGLDLFGTWDAWEIIRSTCKYHSRLAVALSLPKYLPPIAVQTRWFSEPVHLLTLEAASFIKNQKGYPVLSKAHQALIARFMRRRTPPWILLCDVGPIPGMGSHDSAGDAGKNHDSAGNNNDFPTLAQATASSQGRKFHDPTPHLSYMRNLQQRQPPRTPLERFGTGYQDYLQAPLQPLTVNLESITYEVFEKDPIKYDWYERAIARALRDWMDRKKPASGPDGRVVVAVLGAGRGPLVTRALRASVTTGVPIDMWVVEKNPNAFVLLQRHNQSIWGGKAHLVRTDMRSWRGPSSSSSSSDPSSTEKTYPIDILVSELLGSFGDNELSPECLDGATHLLNREHGISIPASYSAHLTPIAAPKLHADINTQKATNPSAPETPYVVMLHAIDYLSVRDSSSTTTNGNNTNKDNSSKDTSNRASTSAPIVPLLQPPTPIVLPAWSFSHPDRNLPQSSTPSSSSSSSSTIPAGPITSTTNAHNTRHARLTFPCTHRGVCHGLAGYFETVLYDGVELSTNPVTMDEKSSGMISWFPIFFPLKTPLYIPDNAELVVTMSRQTDDRKVWYEWMVEVFRLERVSSSSDEKGGRQVGYQRVRVGASELHSSVKDGCLM